MTIQGTALFCAFGLVSVCLSIYHSSNYFLKICCSSSIFLFTHLDWNILSESQFQSITQWSLEHLHKQKFKHSFQDCLNPLCLCSNEIETCTHYLLHCPTYINERMTLLNKIKSINCSILESTDDAVTKILLFGDNTFSDSSNCLITSFWTQQLNSSKQVKPRFSKFTFKKSRLENYFFFLIGIHSMQG